MSGTIFIWTRCITDNKSNGNYWHW